MDSGLINENVVTPQVINSAQPAIALATTDRLVCKVFGKTSVAFATLVHFVHDGVLHASYFSRPTPPPPTVVAHLADGSTHVVSDVFFAPGVTQHTNGLHVFEGGQTIGADFGLGSDGLKPVLPVVIGGLDPSSRYSVTFDLRSTIYTAGASGSMNILIDAEVATDGVSVATVSLNTAPFADTSRLPPALVGATMNVAPSAGGFTVEVARPIGVASDARAKWLVLAFEKI